VTGSTLLVVHLKNTVLITFFYVGANSADVITQQNTDGATNSSGSECPMTINGPVW
jgi:hypothetical protein